MKGKVKGRVRTHLFLFPKSQASPYQPSSEDSPSSRRHSHLPLSLLVGKREAELELSDIKRKKK